jgi:hypothetical protein
MARGNTAYKRLIEHIFLARYKDGDREVSFIRDDIITAAEELGLPRPSNVGDVLYSFRYRAVLPESITEKAPEGFVWVIRPAGTARYTMALVPDKPFTPNELMAETKVPDSTPGIVAKYSMNDEQALLAKVRYNRLIDIFTGVTCYSLQNHLRTTVPTLGQVETDEIYIGVDKRGAHYIFPVQAKGGTDKMGVVQIEQDFEVCRVKFPLLICRAIGAQFMAGDVIALFEFEESDEGVRLASEKHYRLVPPADVSPEDLALYRDRPSTG